MFFSTCKKTQLRLVRGASHTLEITVCGPDGKPYGLQEGDVIRFGVKYDGASSGYLVKKETETLVNGVTHIEIAPEDTMDMAAGEYKFDIGLQSGEGYFPVVRYSDLILEPNVTAKE